MDGTEYYFSERKDGVYVRLTACRPSCRLAGARSTPKSTSRMLDALVDEVECPSCRCLLDRAPSRGRRGLDTGHGSPEFALADVFMGDRVAVVLGESTPKTPQVGGMVSSWMTRGAALPSLLNTTETTFPSTWGPRVAANRTKKAQV